MSLKSNNRQSEREVAGCRGAGTCIELTVDEENETEARLASACLEVCTCVAEAALLLDC